MESPSSKLVLMTMAMAMAVVLLISTPQCSAQGVAPPPSLTPTPAPAPAPEFVNLTDLLTVAGPFHTFLEKLISTKVIDTLQNQANQTEEGVTIFVPKDDAFKNQKSPPLSNLTSDQLKQLLLFHAIPHYYSLAEFKNLSLAGPVNTMAGGGGYSVKFTDVGGTVHIDSEWTKTKISSSVHSSVPVAVYQVDRVLLPVAIFGTDIPPMPAPAPAPEVATPDADSPAADGDSKAKSPATSSPGKSGSFRATGLSALSHLALAVAASAVVALL